MIANDADPVKLAAAIKGGFTALQHISYIGAGDGSFLCAQIVSVEQVPTDDTLSITLRPKVRHMASQEYPSPWHEVWRQTLQKTRPSHLRIV